MAIKNQKAWFEGIISQGPQSSGLEPNYNINLFHPANDINWSTQEGTVRDLSSLLLLV